MNAQKANFIRYFRLFREAVKGEDQDYTSGSIRKAIFMLSIPMILEMVMESLFAIVDIFFVSKISVEAVATVGLTESILTIIYSIAIGISMAATAIVARRVGEKDHKRAADASFQAILIGFAISLIVGVAGIYYAPDLLSLMGASEDMIAKGSIYTRIMLGSNISIMLLFLINGIFRGAGNASIAMRSLWVSNGLNIVLDPLLIFGLGGWAGMGLEGAAWATVIGRSTGVLYQLYHLFNAKAIIKLSWENVVIRWQTIRNIIKVSSGGMGQFLIESASWIFLIRLVSEFGSDILAGYTIAIRIVVFTILPSWGMANAAATLVGQNLGASRSDRAESSVWQTSKINMIFMGVVSVLFFLVAEKLIILFNNDPVVVSQGASALRIFCLGYLFFAYGMVVSQSFNGAGDTRTPTIINLLVFWVIQIPLAYVLAIHFQLEAMGVFITIAFSHSLHALVSIFWFRKGYWKLVKV